MSVCRLSDIVYIEQLKNQPIIYNPYALGSIIPDDSGWNDGTTSGSILYLLAPLCDSIDECVEHGWPEWFVREINHLYKNSFPFMTNKKLFNIWLGRFLTYLPTKINYDRVKEDYIKMVNDYTYKEFDVYCLSLNRALVMNEINNTV